MAAATAATSPKLFLLHCPHPPPSRFPSSSLCYSLPLPSPSVSISISIPVSHSRLSRLSRLPLPGRQKRVPRAFAVAEEEAKVAALERKESVTEGGLSEEEMTARGLPCELYVCNLPRSCDISQLLDLFKPFGTVNSVEVSRDAETGISRGCGYVTISSISEAKAAMAALDGSDLGGREMRVKFSADMVPGRQNAEALNTTPKKNMVFESQHKAYVGNLAWSVRPEDLREHFSQFGTMVSTRVLYDRKGGKNRVYGFISFSTADELKAAIEISGSEFRGRTLLVREIANTE